MIGQGKYDDVATEARNRAGAEGVLLIVLNGVHGNGFSAQLPMAVVNNIPAVLRDVAQQIEADAARARKH